MSIVPPHPAWREASRLLRRYRGPLAGALLLVVANRIASLALPIASRYVVDEVIGKQRTDLLVIIAVLACAAIALETLTGFGASQVAGIAGQRAIAGLRQELQARVLGLPLHRIDESQSGALAARVMTDSEQARYLIGNGLVQLVASILTAALALGLLLQLNASLTVAILTIVGFVAIGMKRLFHRTTGALEGVMRRQSELTGRLGQVLGAMRVVKAYAAERREAHRFARESHRLVRESMSALRGISLLSASSAFAAGSLGVLLLVAGGQLVAGGAMSLGSYVMFAWLTGYLLGPVSHIAASAGELGKSVAALGRIATLRNGVTEAEEDRSRDRVQHIVGAVDCENVHYTYGQDTPVLHQVTLHAPAGSTTALIGPNGSGKSTLCRLLLAYDRPTKGRILIDGRDLAGLSRREYRSHLGVVLQEDILLDGTIGDNIRYGRPRASLAELEAAARLAHCDEFVARLPKGYSTPVGERGLRLSAGQRQRVAIARAFLVNPRLLILDEATSSLDAESERLVQDAIHLLCHGRTTFVVAHRLSTVRSADQIIVLDHGAVKERGTHEELLARRGRYFDRYSGPPSHVPAGFADVIDRNPAWLPLATAEPVAARNGGGGFER